METEHGICENGFKDLSYSKTRYAVIFTDDTCPNCDGRLEIISKKLKDYDYKIRYQCNKCGFICPIHIDIATKEISPVYDETLSNFRKEFQNQKL